MLGLVRDNIAPYSQGPGLHPPLARARVIDISRHQSIRCRANADVDIYGSKSFENRLI